MVHEGIVMFLGRGGRERGCYCLVLSNGIDIEM